MLLYWCLYLQNWYWRLDLDLRLFMTLNNKLEKGVAKTMPSNLVSCFPGFLQQKKVKRKYLLCSENEANNNYVFAWVTRGAANWPGIDEKSLFLKKWKRRSRDKPRMSIHGYYMRDAIHDERLLLVIMDFMTKIIGTIGYGKCQNHCICSPLFVISWTWIVSYSNTMLLSYVPSHHLSPIGGSDLIKTNWNF